jgi:TetR/AcrR family transcriptional regulator
MIDPKRIEGAQDEAARDRLMRAALDLFNRKGYASTTVREIVEAAGVTKPVLYYYFANKEGIYLALFGDAFEALLGDLAAAGVAGGGTRERILHLCDRVYSFTREHLSLVRVMYSIYYGPPQGAPPFDFDASHRAFHTIARKILEEGISKGEILPVPIEDAMWTVVGALNIAMEVDLCHPEQSLGREGLRRILNLVFDGIAAPGRPILGEKP